MLRACARSKGGWVAAVLLLGAAGSVGAAVIPQTITLSRDNGNTVDSKATRLFYNASSSSYENVVYIGTIVYASGWYHSRGFIRFQLPAVLDGKTIESASLGIRRGGGANYNVSVHRLTDSFDPAGVTWFNRASGVHWDGYDSSDKMASEQDYIAVPTATGHDAVESWNYWDVTSDVQAFVSGTTVNDGWVLIGEENGGVANHYDTYYLSAPGGINQSKLIITYTPEPAAAGLLLAAISGWLLTRRKTWSQGGMHPARL